MVFPGKLGRELQRDLGQWGPRLDAGSALHPEKWPFCGSFRSLGDNCPTSSG